MSKFRSRKAIRILLSVLGCLIVLTALGAVWALGAEPESAPPAAETAEPEVLPAEEEQETVTLTFKLWPFGQRTATVVKGEYPTAEQIPVIPDLTAAVVLGWYREDGLSADPASIPATEDAVYTARWERHVSWFLNTDEHNAYIKGYTNGTFKPQKSVSRAEAVQMFYSLLRDKTCEPKTFTDVGTAWYTEAVQTIAGMGIIHGYSDGTFRPDKPITRAEFVTIALACDVPTAGAAAFSDVPETHWAYTAVSSAAAKGWIKGYGDGTFRPDGEITRAQAVAILNRMMGRSADQSLRTMSGLKNFYDVYPDYWAFSDIMEACTTHTPGEYRGAESWTEYEQAQPHPVKSGWFEDGGKTYYLDGATGKFLRGAHEINGVKYVFNRETGAMEDGFLMVNGWRRYFKDGKMLDDISGLGVVEGPYLIKVFKDFNYLIVFAKDSSGNYNTPVRAMRTSCGYSTLVGTFYTPDKYRWLCMIGNSWAQWCTQIQGNYLFHSVPNWTYSNMDLEVDEYNHLGETRSLGCIRLNCRDAKWIFDNCELGTKVIITVTETPGPLTKPAGLAPLPSWHTWDPTDPTAYWRCQEIGCH